MNRLPLLFSILAVVIAVVALVAAILVPGPQGPKGDTGPQGIQGIQGPPSSLSVERQLVHLRGGDNGQTCTPATIHLMAGDVLQGYVGGGRGYWDSNHFTPRFDYQAEVTRDLDGGLMSANLGSGRGGTTFSFLALETGTYNLHVWYEDLSTVVDYYPSGLEEYLTVEYWIQEAADY